MVFRGAGIVAGRRRRLGQGAAQLAVPGGGGVAGLLYVGAGGGAGDGGLESLAGGQQLAALALGLSRPQAYRHVLLPLALRVILPPLASEGLNIIKNSAVALTIGLVELMNSANAIQEFSFQVFEAFTAATAIYVALNIIVVAGTHWLERRLALPGTLGEGMR